MVDLNSFCMGTRVPKVIHQTYHEVNDLPLEIQNNIIKIQQLNPLWEYRLYSDTDMESVILKNYGPDMLRCFNQIDPDYGPARADLFRYLLMYAEGGVYLDIKSSMNVSLDNLLSEDDLFVLSKWNDDKGVLGRHTELLDVGGYEYQQWFIITVPGHLFLKAVIERVTSNIQNYNIFKSGVGKTGVLNVTGPVAYTLGIESVKGLAGYREVCIRSDFDFIYSIYERNNQEKDHKMLFKKHYSLLKKPIIIPQTIVSFISCWLYSLGSRVKHSFKKSAIK